MNWRYRAKVFGEYQYWTNLADANQDLKMFNRRFKIETKINGEWR